MLLGEHTRHEGPACPINDMFLLLGLEVSVFHIHKIYRDKIRDQLMLLGEHTRHERPACHINDMFLLLGLEVFHINKVYDDRLCVARNQPMYMYSCMFGEYTRC